MSVSWELKIDDGEATLGTNTGSIVRRYVIYGAGNHSSAMSHANANAALDYDLEGITLPLSTIKVVPEHVTDAAVDCIWFAEITYAPPGSAGGAGGGYETGDSTYTFNTGGGTANYQVARSHVESYDTSGAIGNPHGGLINVTEGGIGGVDVVTPNFTFSETHYIDALNFNAASISGYTGRVNSLTFRGFNAGEVLFLGATGSKRAGDLDWEISFEFQCSPNISGYTLYSPNGNIVIPTKNGWDYIWCTYTDKYNATTQTMTSVIKAAHVERVYDYADLNGLPI